MTRRVKLITNIHAGIGGTCGLAKGSEHDVLDCMRSIGFDRYYGKPGSYYRVILRCSCGRFIAVGMMHARPIAGTYVDLYAEFHGREYGS